jgi:hypothetical protein
MPEASYDAGGRLFEHKGCDYSSHCKPARHVDETEGEIGRGKSSKHSIALVRSVQH